METGDVLAEIETDKATMEMEAFDDGILHKHLVAAGAKAPVGAKIALLLEKGEKPPAEGAPTRGVAQSQRPPRRTPSAPAAAAEASASNRRRLRAPAAKGERVKASPLAKKDREGKGRGAFRPGGHRARAGASWRRTWKARRPAAHAAKAAAPSRGRCRRARATRKIALSGMRRVIAERLLASKTTIPHFYLNIEVDAGPLMKFRAEANAASEAAGGPKFTVNDFVLKAVVAAAVKVPAVNASFAGDAIIQYGSIHLSVAVAVEEGLVTPVIRDAQKKSLREISEAVKDLAGARALEEAQARRIRRRHHHGLEPRQLRHRELFARSSIRRRR